MLDIASGYHMVKQIHGRKSTDLLADFTDCWMVLAGPPMKVTCDQERGFIKDFADGVEMVGSTVRFDAGQAHWQQGATEGTTSARTTFGHGLGGQEQPPPEAWLLTGPMAIWCGTSPRRCHV